MAERRMFHTSVIGSDEFLDLPAAVQALYFHLGMAADDDGFINGPKQIARKLRRPPKELQMLVDKGFLLDFDGVVVIRHWRMANNLKTDRLQLPRYPDIARKLYINENRIYTKTRIAGTQNLFQQKKKLLSSHGIQMESKRNPDGIPEEKKGKEKRRKEKKIEEKKVEEKNTDDGVEDTPWDLPAQPGAAASADPAFSMNFLRGKLGKGVVLLSEAQSEELLDKMGLDSFDYYVEKLADYILAKQVKVKNHYATILKWWEEDRSVCL